MRFSGIVIVSIWVLSMLLGLENAGIAGESGFGVHVGDTEESVLKTLGKPKGSMDMSGRKTLAYSGCYVVIENGAVVQVDGRSPSRSESVVKEAESMARSSPVAKEHPEKDVQALIKKIQTASGTELAYAVQGCNGEWAAEAIPILISLLEDSMPFEVITYNNGERYTGGGTTLGQIAGESLGTIGMAAWEPCMSVLQNGSAFARANAAEALVALWEKAHFGDAAFPAALMESFCSPTMASSPQALKFKGRMASVVERVNTPEALAALHGCLPHSDSIFTATILDCLGRRGDLQSIPFLAEAFLNSSDEYVRRVAGEALLSYSDPATGRAVLSGVTHPNADTRRVMAEIFGRVNVEEFAPALIGLLKDDEERVRRMAVWSLGRIGSEKALLPLIDVALNDSSESVAQDAFHLLGGPTLKNQDLAVVKALLPGLCSSDAKRRAWSAELLGRTGAAEAFAPLAKAARSDLDVEVRRKALSYLDEFANIERSDVMLNCLLEESMSQVRQVAMQSVKYGSLREKQEEILLRLVHGENSERAREAAFVLDELHLVKRNPEILSVLIQTLESADPKVREHAEEVLCREANIARFSAKGKELGNNPTSWKAWWKEQGVAVR